MTVATWQIPNFSTQSGTNYKTNIDGDFAVAARFADMFAPHEQSTPDMTVRLDAGFVFDHATPDVTEVAAQSTGTITAPVTNPRIDRVVVDESTGSVSVITGAEAASPVAPAITSGKIPICQVSLATSTTSITNSLITDERVFWQQPRPGQFLSSAFSGGQALSANNVTIDASAPVTSELNAVSGADISVIRSLAGVKYEIEVIAYVSGSAQSDAVFAIVEDDTTVLKTAAIEVYNNELSTLAFKHIVSSPGTGLIEYQLYGAVASGTLYVNRTSGQDPYMGGLASIITLKEHIT